MVLERKILIIARGEENFNFCTEVATFERVEEIRGEKVACLLVACVCPFLLFKFKSLRWSD